MSTGLPSKKRRPPSPLSSPQSPSSLDGSRRNADGWTKFRRGEVLILSQAAKIADVTNETVRRWCEQTETDRPVGLLIGSLWLVDLDLNVERAAG